MTLPPFVIASVPVPKLPILSPLLGPLIHAEPGPVTVTVPVEPTDSPTEPPPLFTVPPFWIVRVPMPWPPATMLPATDQLEPGSVTVTAPVEPGKLPIAAKELINVPPVRIVSIPVPVCPTAMF